MRILLLTQFYPPIVGGEERHVRNLGAALAWRGHQVSAATLWVPGAEAEKRDGEVRVHRIRGTRVYREVQRERPVARRAGSGELFGGRQ